MPLPFHPTLYYAGKPALCMSAPEGYEQVDLGSIYYGTSNTELQYTTRQNNLEDVENMIKDLGLVEARGLFRKLTPAGLYRNLDDNEQVIRMSITDVYRGALSYSVSMAYVIEKGSNVLQFRIEDLEGGGLDIQVSGFTAGQSTMIINYYIPK